MNMGRKRKNNSLKERVDRQLQLVSEASWVFKDEFNFYKDLSGMTDNHLVMRLAEKLCKKLDALVSDMDRLARLIQTGTTNEVLRFDFEVCDKITNIISYLADGWRCFDNNHFLIVTLTDTCEKLDKVHDKLYTEIN